MLNDVMTKGKRLDIPDDVDDYESTEKMSDILSSFQSERSEQKRNRHWLLRSVLKVVNAPPIVIGFLCRITIPLTDEEHWDDRIAMISCITAPLFMQFAFGILSLEIVDGVELWHIAIVGGTVTSAVTCSKPLSVRGVWSVCIRSIHRKSKCPIASKPMGTTQRQRLVQWMVHWRGRQCVDICF